MAESTVIKKIQIEATGKGWRLFRNNVGQAWQGVGKAHVVKKETELIVAHKNDVILKSGRRIDFGLHEGSSDNIGWAPVEITPDMVGKKLAVFVSVECKTQAYKRATDAQKNWLHQVAASGGIAYLATEKPDGSIFFERID